MHCSPVWVYVVLATVCLNHVTCGAADRQVVTSGTPDRQVLPRAVDVTKQVSIWLTSPPPATVPRTFGCTGAVIGRSHVLASASCVSRFQAERIQVSVGLEDVSASEVFAQVTSITLNSAVDLAVLQLSADFFADTSVATLIQGQLTTGITCQVSGWNFDNSEWEEQEVSYMTSEDCTAAYESVGSTVQEGMICATTTAVGGNAACKESLGWQLQCDGELAGLFSWTDFSCQRPGVYSSVSDAATWISEAKGDASGLQLSVVMLVGSVMALRFAS